MADLRNQCQKNGFHYCPNCDNRITDPEALQAQLAAVQNEREALKEREKDLLHALNCHGKQILEFSDALNERGEQLAAVTQERNQLKQENFTAHSLAMQWHQIWLLFSGAHYDQESWLAEYKKVFEVGERLAQLQARSRKLVEALGKVRDEPIVYTEIMKEIARAALADEENP